MKRNGEYRVTKTRRLLNLPEYRIEWVEDGRFWIVCPSGNTIEELRESLEEFRAALDKPIVESEQ